MSDDKEYWLDKPNNIRKLIIGVVIICAGLLIAEFFYEKHAHFAVEHWFGFYGFYGFYGLLCFCVFFFFLVCLLFVMASGFSN